MTKAALPLLLLCGLLWHTPAAAGGKACLGTAPVAAGDAAALAAVRLAVDAQCPCDAFTGERGLARRDYVACSKGVVKQAVDALQLRRECRATALYPVSRSVCGHGASRPRVVCAGTSKSGKASCKIASPTSCKGPRAVACLAFENCLDAADTNHDLRVGAGDSGACNAVVACANPPRDDGAACDDGNPCTRNDTCTSRVCGGTPYVCDDAGPCQEPGTCNGDGTCAFAARPDGTTCDAGEDVRPPLTCTGGTCGVCTVAGTCSTTTSRPCVVDGHCPGGETCVSGPPPSPRFVDNRDGTVTDRASCLVWEKKGGHDGTPVVCPGGATCGDLHDADNRYAWSGPGLYGAAFTEFLAGLNAGAFAGHTTWRLPFDLGTAGSPPTAPRELESLVDASAPGCGSGAACAPAAFTAGCTPACSGSDPTCSCTATAAHWTDNRTDGSHALAVDFGDGSTGTPDRLVPLAVRAVRGGLPYLDCQRLADDAVPRIAEAPVIACYNGCSVIEFSQCLDGCLEAYHPLSDVVAAAANACTADPGGGCEAYGAALQTFCATVPAPPTRCVTKCAGKPLCEERCSTTANCEQAAQRAVEACEGLHR